MPCFEIMAGRGLDLTKGPRTLKFRSSLPPLYRPMGTFDVESSQDEGALRIFARQLIQDVRALEHMLQEGMLETDVRRVGSEQEMFLADSSWNPAPIAETILEHSDIPNLVPELTRFNLEINLDPLVFKGDCLSRMEANINERLAAVRALVESHDAHVVLTGILPTIRLTDASIENMTPRPRYFALNDAISRLRGGPMEIQIRGTDELYVTHDSIMLEGCNTSFQTHFQVSPNEFARLYNIAQTVAAPVLAAAANSPLLFGKRLWRETRIALFQQAVDTRGTNLYLREMSPRVHFGSNWVDSSVMEIFKEDIARFRVLLTAPDIEDPFVELSEGRVPKLSALQLHNGTVYRWNRACYGIYDGKPHLRIENRILPSGPSVVDEVANAAFWFGLVSGLARAEGDVRDALDFDDAKTNFIVAARVGLAAQFTWLHGRREPAQKLILEELLPLAREGLLASEIDEQDADRYLGVIDARVRSRQTGSQWMLDSYNSMRQQGSRAERLAALVAGMAKRQAEGAPVHEWSLASVEEAGVRSSVRQSTVEHFMSTDLITVNEDELVELVACLMDWRHIRHIMVEDNKQRLVGLVSHRNVLRFLAEYGPSREGGGIPIKEIMVRNPISIEPHTPTMAAVRIMRENKIGALPVVRDGHLLGIITEHDFIRLAGQLLEEDDEGSDSDQNRSSSSKSSSSSSSSSSTKASSDTSSASVSSSSSS
jgi:CBS domain-containing protein